MIDQYYPAAKDIDGSLSSVARSFALFCCDGVLGAQALFVARGNLQSLADTLRPCFPALADECQSLADASTITARDASTIVDSVRAALR